MKYLFLYLIIRGTRTREPVCWSACLHLFPKKSSGAFHECVLSELNSCLNEPYSILQVYNLANSILQFLPKQKIDKTINRAVQSHRKNIQTQKKLKPDFLSQKIWNIIFYNSLLNEVQQKAGEMTNQENHIKRS